MPINCRGSRLTLSPFRGQWIIQHGREDQSMERWRHHQQSATCVWVFSRIENVARPEVHGIQIDLKGAAKGIGSVKKKTLWSLCRGNLERETEFVLACKPARS